MDAVSQRKGVAWIAALLATVWSAQLVQHGMAIYASLLAGIVLPPVRDWSLFLGWSLVWTAFMFALYLAQIPMIRFDFRRLTVIVACIVVIHTALLFSSSPVSVRSVVHQHDLLSRHNTTDELDVPQTYRVGI